MTLAFVPGGLLPFRSRRARSWRLGPQTVVALVVLLSGCSRDSGGRVQDPDKAFAAEMVRLKGTVLYEGDVLGNPLEIAQVGERLVVLDALNDPAVHLFRVSDGRHERSFGRKGSGPREFRGVATIDPVPGSSDEFWVFDRQLARFTHVGVRPDTVEYGRRLVTFGAEGHPMAPLWLGDTLLVSQVVFQSTGRLARFDSAGRLLGTVGRLPDAEDGTPPMVLQHAYTGSLVASPDRSRLALLARHADRLEIYQTDGTLVRTVTEPMAFTPVFEVHRRGGTPYMATGEDLRFGYITASAGPRHLFGLFSGRTRADRPGRAHYGSFVRVFDWDGSPRAVYKLDAYIFGIGISPDERTLYALRDEPTPAILTYALPPIP